MEFEISSFERGINVGGFGLPGSLVPQHDDAGTVAFGDNAFEFPVVEGVIFNPHREAFVLGIQTGSFGDGPGEEDPFVLEAEVVMQMGCEVLLDAEEKPFLPRRALRSFLDVALRFRRRGEVALGVVLSEGRFLGFSHRWMVLRR